MNDPFACRSQLRDLRATARSISAEDWSRERARQFWEGYRRACNRFLSYEGWQKRVPSNGTIRHLLKLEHAAYSVARFGLSELRGQKRLIGDDCLRIARAYNLPKRSTKAFQENLARLRSLLPDRDNAADDEFGDRALASALTGPPTLPEPRLAEMARLIFAHSTATSNLVLTCHCLAKRARSGQRRARKARDMAVPKGHLGDYASNVWIDGVLQLYRYLTGKKPSFSVGKPGRSGEGQPSGPLLLFLQAAYAPLVMRMTWRNGVDRRQFMASLEDLSTTEQKTRRLDYSPLFPVRLLHIEPSGWRSRVMTALKHQPPDDGGSPKRDRQE